MKFWQAARAKLHGKSKSKRLNLNLHFNSSLNADLWIGPQIDCTAYSQGIVQCQARESSIVGQLSAHFKVLFLLQLATWVAFNDAENVEITTTHTLPQHTHTTCVCWLQAIRLSCLRAINHAEMWELSLTGARVELREKLKPGKPCKSQNTMQKVKGCLAIPFI